MVEFSKRKFVFTQFHYHSVHDNIYFFSIGNVTRKIILRFALEQTNIADYFLFHSITQSNSFIILFYRQFRICITNASGKAHTPL